MKPITAQGNPTNAMSNMPSPECPRSVMSIPLTTRFVLVPTSVHMPPKIAAKLNGIMSFDGLIRSPRAQSLTTGMNMATTGMLLRNALMAMTGPMSRANARRGPDGCPRTWRVIQARPPVCCKPATTTQRMPTVSMPGLLKPINASLTSSVVETKRTVSPPMKIMSAGMRVNADSAKVPPSTAIAVQPCQESEANVASAKAGVIRRPRRALRGRPHR